MINHYFLSFLCVFSAMNAIDERLENSVPMVNGERHIVVVTCSYNNSLYLKTNLHSVFFQNYSNYHIIYVDDCSWDGTARLVKEYAVEQGMMDKVILIENTKRKRALQNLYEVIHMCKPTDIIALLDGDDWFAHDGVLAKLNEVYADPNIWLTYGQFREYPSGSIGFCAPYPKEYVERNGFRYYALSPSHLRTFYAGLFQKIRKDDLMFQGEFFAMTYDLAIMFPMLEMARTHFTFIPDVLLEYNCQNEISDYIVNKKMQRKFDLIIRARTCYQEIESPS